MIRLSIVAAVAATLVATCGYAAESKIRIENGGRGIVGVLHLPDDVTSPPVVLMLHGFTGQKDEFPMATSQTGLFAHTAERLADVGMASLRIDFHGSGESDGRWEETTLSGQIQDAVLAFDYLQALASVDNSRIGILGYSQGGLVGGHLAARRPEASAVVLWAPVTNPLSTYATIMGGETVQKALAEAPDKIVTAKLSWGGDTRLNAAFFKELPTVTPVGAIGSYPGPLRVIVGKRETIVTPQPAAGQILLDYHQGVEDLVEIDSDHDWNAGTTTQTVDEVLIPKSAEWFQTHLSAE